MLQKLRHFLEMIRFSHTVFALPFAFLSALMAWTTPADPPIHFRWRDLLGILACMVFARSAAMTFNRLADRKIDAENPRTAMRHLPAGLIGRGQAILFTAVMSTGFVASTLNFLPNTLPLFLSLPVLVFICAYSLTKRFTSLAHFWLGASLFLAPVSAWIAIRGSVLMRSPLDILPAVWLGAAVLLWVSGFDIIYACQDAEFDRKAKLKSVPAAVGIERALTISAFCHLLMLPFLFTLPLVDRFGGPPLSLGWVYVTGVVCVALLLIYEHWLVRPDDLTRVQTAFFNVNAIVSVGLLVIVALDLLI